MRRIMCAAVAVAVGAWAAPASATHSAGRGPKADAAHGRGHFEGIGPAGPTDLTMQFTASQDASGGVRGHFFTHRTLPAPELHVHGELTCLTVVGNRATIGGRIVHRKQEAAPPGSGVVIQVVDLGQGRHGSDQMQGTLTPTPPVVCPAPPVSARLTVQQGNFTVHDSAG